VETFLADDATALRYLDESLRLFRALDDKPALAYTLLALAHTAIHLGDVNHARACLAECLALLTDLGDYRGIIWSTNAQADLALHLGDMPAAVALYEQALHLARTAPGPPMMGPLIALAYISAGQAVYTRALEQLSEALALADTLDLPTARAHSLGVLAKIAYLRGWSVPAVRLFAHAQALFDSAGLRLEPPVHTDAAEYEQLLTELQQTLPTPAFEQAWTTGRTQTPQQLLAGMRRRHQHAGAAPVPGGNAGSRLTAREIEVLRLVAAGLTNPQVAARLTVTPHTINMHLRAIYAKLDVTTRAGAAGYAAVHHLI
jgi:ATP/maltotriose-dependent transcriptional regulator MalT